MWIDPVNTDEFVRSVGACLQHNNPDQLADTIRDKWTPQQLCTMLHNRDAAVRRVAVIALGLVGELAHLHCLTGALRDEDQQVYTLAENALWTIWFRNGSPRAQRLFNRGLVAMDNQECEEALDLFRQAKVEDPEFAEAYHQASIVRYIMEDWYTAIQDARQAITLMPVHFGAWATMGHCYVQIGDVDQAAACYRRAVNINPRMHAISRALKRIEKAKSKISPSIVTTANQTIKIKVNITN